MKRKPAKRRHIPVRLNPSATGPEPRQRAELGPDDFELILIFSIIPYLIQEEEDMGGGEEIGHARSFHVRTLLEHPTKEVPWRRIAEVLSPFVIRAMGEGLLDFKPGDIEPGFSATNMATVCGIARYDRPPDEDEQDVPETAFSGLVVLRFNFVGDRTKGQVRTLIEFAQAGDEGRFEFAESP